MVSSAWPRLVRMMRSTISLGSGGGERIFLSKWNKPHHQNGEIRILKLLPVAVYGLPSIRCFRQVVSLDLTNVQLK